MQDFIQQYDHQEFEIITELHNGYSTFFVGWLWKNQIPVSAQVEIFNFGEMIIRIGKQVFQIKLFELTNKVRGHHDDRYNHL